jgi:hypothetical protein
MSPFAVPEAKPVEPFTFTLPFKAPWWAPWRKPPVQSIPLVQNLSPELITGLGATVAGINQSNLTEEAAKRIWDFQVAVFENYAPGTRAALTDDQLVHLVGAWYRESNLSLGESSASPTS